jgi:hypothetical protein
MIPFNPDADPDGAVSSHGLHGVASLQGVLHFPYFDRFMAALKRSRLLQMATTVALWFTVASALGAANWFYDGKKHSLIVYIYNAFTVFSNLNDDLGLVLTRGGEGGYTVSMPAMLISVVLIICGMLGIALLTATITSNSINMDEEKFDRLVDELRRLAVIATCRPTPGEEPVDAHRILNRIISHIRNSIVPFRTNTSVHQLNIYEFEYILVNVINRIIEHRNLLSDPVYHFAGYNLEHIIEVIQWFNNLDDLHEYINDPCPSPISANFKDAWNHFSVDLVERARAAQSV